MGETTEIAWTDSTFNPWIGCSKVSPGCANCYAEKQDKRWGNDSWGPGKERRRTSASNWRLPLRWDREAAKSGVRRRVFCASLADVFDPEVPPAWRANLYDLILDTPHLDWLLLTKRPEMFEGQSPSWLLGYPGKAWPINVWLGVTVENQEQADKRIPLLLAQDARVRFLSMEPLLGPVDFNVCTAWHPGTHGMYLEGIHWVIVGGESGPKSRPFDLAWARSVRDQCTHAGAACFVKQLGADPIEPTRPSYWRSIVLRDSKGGDWDEWPADLRVREFPAPRLGGGR